MNDLRRWMNVLREADTAMINRAAAIVLDWVNQERRDTQTWAHLFASVQPVLDETTPKNPVRLYRNELRDNEAQYDRFTSWTTDSAMASDYPAGGGGNRQLVSAMIAPKDMVCFIPAFGPRVDWLGQQEMIVRPGRYQRTPLVTEGAARLSEVEANDFRNTCVPLALHLISDIPYEKIHAVCAKHGWTERGMKDSQQFLAMKELGIQLRDGFNHHLIGTTLRQFLSVINPHKTFLVDLNGHLTVVKNGQVVDDTHPGLRSRVQMYRQVIYNGEPAEADTVVPVTRDTFKSIRRRAAP